MSSAGSVTHWIGQLKEGDSTAAQQLWERYFQQLVQLARSKLRSLPRQAMDEEDVALSAFDSFCRDVQRGRFPDLLDRDNLWRLLLTFTAQKALDLVRREQAQKRFDPQRAPLGDEEIEQIISREPTPEFAAQVGEEYQRLLSTLGNADLQAVALWKMEGYTNAEIAANLGCVERTVERKLRGYPEALVPGEHSMINPFEDNGAFTPSLVLRVEEVCDHFEASWKAAAGSGAAPRIEQYLAEVPEQDRSVLLSELLPLELIYRRRAGEQPNPEEYRLRFPLDSALIDTMFGQDRDAELDSAPEIRVRVDEADLERWPRTLHLPELTQEQDQAQPRLFGYLLLGELGRGSMGVVYKARQLGLKRNVALKMILSGVHAGRKELARFRIEAEAIARLQHPNIIQIYEVGDQEGRPFFSLELVEGGNLAQKLAGTPLPPRQAAGLLLTLAQAVHYAHQRGVVHRDLKPANVLLTADGTPKITDFSMAKRLDNDAEQTRSGAIMGTPSYMAPEQAEGKPRLIGKATDVYALGAILYEMLTGRPPFRAASLAETLEQVRHQDPVPPRQLQPKLSRDLETICLKCLEKGPHRRYASAEALAQDLRHFLAGEPILARRARVWERCLKWVKRRPTTATLSGICALLAVVLIGGGFVYQQRYQHNQQEEHQRLAALRWKTQREIDRGRDALDAHRRQEAKECFAVALAAMGSEPALADLKKFAESQLAEANQQLTAHQRFEDFVHFHTEALFHGMLSADGEAARKAAWEALSLFGLTHESDSETLVLDPSLTEGEKTQIKNGCYEMLLILSEIVVQSSAGQEEPGSQVEAQEGLRLLDRAARVGGPTRAYHRKRARLLVQLGDLAGAQKEREREVALQANTALDHFLLGEDQLRLGKAAESVPHFRNAVRLQPDHFWAHYFLAVCYLRLSEPGKAQAELTTCLIKQPDFPWVYLLRGLAHGQLNEFAAAEADFQKASELLKARPNEDAAYGIHVNRGVLHSRQKNFPAAVAELEAAIQLQSNQYQAYEYLARVYHQEGKVTEVVQHLDQAIQRAEKLNEEKRIDRSVLPSLYRQRGRMHQEGGDLSAALQDVERAIQGSWHDKILLGEAYAERGRILQQSKKQQEALRAYNAALEAHPAYLQVNRWRAEVLVELERYREAVQALDRYLEKGEQSAAIYRARGLVRGKLGDYLGAVEDYTQALALKPDADTHADRGWAYLVSDAPRPALRDFEAALRLQPENGDAYNGRGFAQVKLGQYQQAVEDAEEAARRGPPTFRMLWNSARIYAQAVGALDAVPKQDNPRMLLTRFEYQARALELLRHALDSLPPEQRPEFWKRYLLADVALKPLHQSAQFASMAAELSRKEK